MQEVALEKDGKKLTSRQQATLERRRHIVETAAICFIEQGFHQTSIRDIAARAGISLGNLYNHFKSKTALIAEIANLEAEDLVAFRALLEKRGPAAERLDAFTLAYFDYVAQPENAILTAEITAEAMRSTEIVGGFFENRKKLVAALTAVLENAPPCPADLLRPTAEAVLDLIEVTAARAAFGSRAEKKARRGELTRLVTRLVFLR